MGKHGKKIKCSEIYRCLFFSKLLNSCDFAQFLQRFLQVRGRRRCHWQHPRQRWPPGDVAPQSCGLSPQHSAAASGLGQNKECLHEAEPLGLNV